MSAGGYDAPHMSSAFSRFVPRRSSGNIPIGYDRLPNGAPRRRTPSPPPRRAYDSYIPHHPDVTIREGMPNVYRPNNYRPDYSSNNYYNRSSSPDPYLAPSRLPDPEPWDRGNLWRPPLPPLDTPNVRTDRKSIPSSPTTSTRGRVPRDEAPTRLFEPSNSWKQTHVDRSLASPPSEHSFGRRGIDGSPDRPIHRAPAFVPGGDRYRTAPISSKRDSFSSVRPEYGSFRPQSDNGWASLRREPVSPSHRHHRRDSGPFNRGRTSSRHDAPRIARAVSRKTSVSPLPANPSVETLRRPTPESTSWDFVDSVKQDIPPRALSRSSIASTQASERQSPPAAPALDPSSQLELVSPASIVTEPVAPIAPIAPDEPIKDVKPPSPDLHKLSNGTINQELVQSGNELQPAKEVITVVGNELIPDVSTVANVISPAPKQPLNTIQSPSKPTVETPLPSKETPNPATAGQVEQEQSVAPVQSGPRKAPRPATPVLNHPMPPVSQAPVQIPDRIEIKQPIPSYIPVPIVSPVDDDMDINIPPTTHSPVLESHSPDIRDNDRLSPLPFRRDIPAPEDIPPLSEAKTSAEALRIVVMTRLLYDQQTREERVNPVLMANLSIAAPLEVHPTATPETLLDKMFSGQSLKDKMDSFITTRPKLATYLRQRQGMVDDKIARLREEYVTRQERWLARCNTLNERQKTLASEHESQHSGRTTRRSTAITDAVRSDFEMEQIIASLGVDDATDPNCLSLRNNARIPDMISVTNGQVDYVFDDTTHLVENPAEYYAPQTGIHDWTEVEKKIFLDKFAAHPKQFGIIADFLPNKTAAQCVDYYYLHKKNFIDFRKVVSQFAPNKRRRRGMGKKKGNGLLVDIAKHDMEVRGSEAVSAQSTPVVTRAPRGRKTVVPPAEKKAAARRNAVQFEDTPTSTPTPEPESTRPRRRKTAVTSTPLATSVAATPTPEPPPVSKTPIPSASTAPTPSISKAPTPSLSAPLVMNRIPPPPPPQEQTNDRDTDVRPAKRVKRTRKIKSAATISDEHLSPGPETDKALPSTSTNEDSTNRSKKDKSNPSAWSEEDKNLFLSLLSQHGANFKRIAASMPNKTTIQVSQYYSTDESRFSVIALRAPKRSPTPPEQNVAWKELPSPGSGMLATATAPNSSSLSSSRPPTPPMASLSYEYSNRMSRPFAATSYSSSYRDSSARSSFTDSMFGSQDRQRVSNPMSSQPPMARLGSNGSPDNRRPVLYNDPTPPYRNASYLYRGSNVPNDGSGRHFGLSSPQSQPKQPYFTPMYHPLSAPPNGRPTYTPSTPVSSGSAAPIIHSPTGMSSPKIPAQNPQPYAPPHPDSPHHGYYPLPVPVDHRPNTNWGPPRLYNAEGSTTSYYVGNGRRRASGSSDGKGNGMRRDSSYPIFSQPPPPSTTSSRGSYSSQPPASPPVSRPGQYFHPGWTPMS